MLLFLLLLRNDQVVAALRSLVRNYVFRVRVHKDYEVFFSSMNDFTINELHAYSGLQ